MSRGTKGYCALGKEDNPAGECTQEDVVAVWDVCARYASGAGRAWDD